MNKDKIFKLAKGFRGRAKNCIRIARERVEKALQYSYRDRRNKKRDMRSLWIERINAGARLHGVNYGNFMHGLMKENIQLNRKVLSELSMHEPYSFKALVDISKRTLLAAFQAAPGTPLSPFSSPPQLPYGSIGMEEGSATAKPRRATGRLCSTCNQRKAALKRPKTLEQICRECFYSVFEDEIHNVIMDNNLFKPGERVAVAASGGKDSTVLAYVMSELNRRHNYGLNLFLLSVDEGITGYRDDSLETVKRNEIEYGLPLKVVSYKDLYGWTMDEIVKTIGLKNNCTFCGVFRRQALDRGAALMKADKLVTGHNADDIAETVLLNILRGDIARLSRCTFITTGEDGPIPRCKPFKYTYEKEIVMYAYFKKLDYFSTECIYSPNAYRGFAREFIKDLERMRPRAILDIIRSGENFRTATSTKMPEQGTCERCGYISSQKLCKACLLLEGLNRGLPKLGIGRARGTNGLNKRIEQRNLHSERTESSIESKQCGTLDF
ncbi:Cytoplasmic tRNA 2-thiolation protein [Musa troglodytarum]|uniref:Cytoplasmic tRNA 2-thiolation protein 1 n=1 Tax=Musa troglodytarum TaxID=320322 RepID=A0A9E7GJ16_9LILI|nr:Cytoplasmic tRNA 2-thiolation protein [Musa troglodytarum]